MNKKILITGGSGTVGRTFMEQYPHYEYYNVSRNETNITSLSNKFPKVTNFIVDVSNLEDLIRVFNKVKPDIVIHAAAIKHVNLAEENPTSTILSNIIGSLNVVKASIKADVPITIGISTDKACNPDNVYGYTKQLMESIFFEHHTERNKFICTRFANVACSNGSVIPFFKKCVLENTPLLLTDPNMNRLMFSKSESSTLIHQAIIDSQNKSEPFILSKIMQSVNMLELTSIFNHPVKVVGKRPGEKLNETLISLSELPYSYVSDKGYIYLFNTETPPQRRLKHEHSSLTAKTMTSSELLKLIKTN